MSRNNNSGKVLMLMAATTFVSTAAAAQSLGDVAREERARRADLKSHSHVLTNEDLKRDQILDSKPAWPAVDSTTVVLPTELRPTEKPVVMPAAVPLMNATITIEELKIDASKTVSLGEYARAIRAQRALREAERAKAILEAKKAAPVPAPVPFAVTEEVVTIAGGHRNRPKEIPAPKVRFAFTWPSLPKQSASAYLAPKHEALARPVESATLVTKSSSSTFTSRRRAAVFTASSVKSASLPVSTVKAPAVKPVAKATVETKSINGGAIQVQRGESLWSLARKHFGNGKLWTKIWKANPGLRNPNVIRAGMTLSLPTMPDAPVVARAISGRTVTARPFEKVGVERISERRLSAIRAYLNR